MTTAQWISTIILMFWPILFPAAFWFFELPKRQRQALAQFAPMAAIQMKKRPTLSPEANMQLALNFMAKAFKASMLPHYSEEIVQAAIEACLPNQI